MKCPQPGSISNGKVTPVFAQYLYRDYIHVRCNPGYKLMMVRFKIMLIIKLEQKESTRKFGDDGPSNVT